MSLPSAFSDAALATALKSRLPSTLQPLCSQASPNLPALENTCRKVLSLTGGMNAADRVTQVLISDPALTCKVLQVANSLVYSPPQPITSVSHAVAWLGMDAVRGLVDTAHLVEHLHQRSANRQIVNGVIARALAAAVHAVEMGTAVRYPDPTQLFTNTVLYTIGDLAIANQDPELYHTLRHRTVLAETAADRAAAELALLKVPLIRLTHALAHLWSLPPSLIDLFTTAREPLPDHWQTDTQQLKGLVEGATTLIAGLTGPARPALLAHLKRRIQAGIGLTDDERFSELLNQALDHSHQLLDSAGLSLDGWDASGPVAARTPAPATAKTPALPAPIETNPQETIQALQLALADTKDLPSLLDAFTKRLRRDGGFTRIAVALLNPKLPDQLTGTIVLGVQDRVPYLSTISGSLSQDHPFFQQIINSTEPLIIADFTASLSAPLDPVFLHIWNPGSAIMAPLRAGTKPLGMLFCDGGPYPNPLPQNAPQAFTLFYQQLSASLAQFA